MENLEYWKHIAEQRSDRLNMQRMHLDAVESDKAKLKALLELEKENNIMLKSALRDVQELVTSGPTYDPEKAYMILSEALKK